MIPQNKPSILYKINLIIEKKVIPHFNYEITF